MLLKQTFYFMPQAMRRLLFSIIKPKEYQKMQLMRTIDTDDGYTYKPFDQYQCIFVHIPKAAGVSVSKTLFGNLAGGHSSVTQYQLVFSKKDFNNYFKFTFVRNPWDRVFSAYNFLKAGGMNEKDKKWAETNIAPYRCFQDFVITGLQKPIIQNCIHFKPQSNFLMLPHNHNIQVDFIGLYENIKNDFIYVVNKLGMPKDTELGRENVSNLGLKLDYKKYYFAEMRNIVSKIYRLDIDIFGYNFDNTSLQSQLSKRMQQITHPRC